MKRNLPLTLPVEGSIYPFKIDGHCELHAVDRIDLGQGLMYLRALAAPHKERPTFINDVVRMVRPNDATAWLPVLREHYTMDDEGRAALIAEAKENPYSSVAKNQKWLAAFDAESGPYTPMVVCHNGEDLARAFPQVPNDLSRDLYATIGDPVPPLVWPRQESEQSPARTETEELCVSRVMRVEDFAVGARVTVVKKVETLSDGTDMCWTGTMDLLLGASGTVHSVRENDVLVSIDGIRPVYSYAPEALALENACSEAPAVEPPTFDEVANGLSVMERAKPHVYKTGDKVKVARAIMRDSAGHWCFWTGALEMTIGCTGEVLALVPNETAGAYLYIRVDGHEFYYSPEALDLVTAAE